MFSRMRSHTDQMSITAFMILDATGFLFLAIMTASCFVKMKCCIVYVLSKLGV